MTAPDYDLLPEPIEEIVGDLMSTVRPSVRDYATPMLSAVLSYAQQHEIPGLAAMCDAELRRRSRLQPGGPGAASTGGRHAADGSMNQEQTPCASAAKRTPA